MKGTGSECGRMMMRFGMLLPIVGFFYFVVVVGALTDSVDRAVLQGFMKSVKGLPWIGNQDDPCGSKWKYIQCSETSSVTALNFEDAGLAGQLPSNVNQLKNLQYISLQGNSFSGPLPTFKGLSNLEQAYLDGNQFSSIPADFFNGLLKLTLITLDHNPLNSSTGWTIPNDLSASGSLSFLSLTNTSIAGSIPSFLGKMSSLQTLRLAYNYLNGSVPSTFRGSNFIVLQLNNQQSQPPLTGSIEVVGTMQSLTEVWLQVNQFSGTIPETIGSLASLEDCRLNDNQLVGPIPESFTKSVSLNYFSVNNNNLDGSIPNVSSVTNPANYSFTGRNYFCQREVGVECSPQVNALLSFLGGVRYPLDLVQSWASNNPCLLWTGIVCDGGNVITINLPNRGLTGNISSALVNLPFLQTLVLSGNNLTGQIPMSLASSKSLRKVDVRDNHLYGPLPPFSSSVTLLAAGNTNINKTESPLPSNSSNGTPDNSGLTNPGNSTGVSGGTSDPAPSEHGSSSVPVGTIAGPVVGASVILFAVALAVVMYFKKKRQKFLRVQSPNTIVVRPSGSGGSDGDLVKIVVGNSVTNGTASEAQSRASSGPSGDTQVVEAGNLVISIQVLRSVTNNFSEENVLGKGGFGVVYKGELDDGTKIAVKRMEASIVSSKGLNEFQAEIAVLTKVRHRHLVSLLGYCIDGNERLLVYEYMPLGPLSQHLFDLGKVLPPLNWKRRLSVALDVARGMEYLHGLAHKSFIHRDLKPSNILLGDDYRAKVSDFGLVKLAPEGKFSVETKLAGTFGYLAPEYAVTGRVTTKSDVFSFGVVLMELITGRRALDESQPEESMHLVSWFRRMSINKEAFTKAIDGELEMTEETFQSICTVAQLAGHCTAREPYQRPDMSHAVNVLSPLVEQWKPTDTDGEEGGGIDLDLTLPQALKKWQAYEADSSISDLDNSRASLPTRPTGFADSFTSSDGR